MPGSRAPSDARTQGAIGLDSPSATEDAAARRVIAGQAPPSTVGWFTRYPCLCLCRGLVQMTMVVPCRLITRHRSHMGLTEARTFTRYCLSSVAVGDST